MENGFQSGKRLPPGAGIYRIVTFRPPAILVALAG